MAFHISTLLACLMSGCAKRHLSEARFPSTPTISEQDVRSDLSTWRQGMIDLHPDISHRIDLKRLQKKVDDIEQNIGGDMTQLEVWRLFAQINPILGDGHNGILMPKGRELAEKYLKDGGRVFPYAVHNSRCANKERSISTRSIY